EYILAYLTVPYGSPLLDGNPDDAIYWPVFTILTLIVPPFGTRWKCSVRFCALYRSIAWSMDAERAEPTEPLALTVIVRGKPVTRLFVLYCSSSAIRKLGEAGLCTRSASVRTISPSTR